MTTRERPADRGNRLARRGLLAIGAEVREARLAAGLSQSRVGSASGVSHATIGRIERGLEPGASMALLARVAAAVGLDLSIRLYPGGDAVRDAGHLRLLNRLRVRLGPPLTRRTEIPLPGPGDARAWDAVITDPSGRVVVEAETRLRDLQAPTRRIELKCRDGAMDRVILVVAETSANRRALTVGRDYPRASFTLDGRSALRSLTSGELPETSALIVL